MTNTNITATPELGLTPEEFEAEQFELLAMTDAEFEAAFDFNASTIRIGMTDGEYLARLIGGESLA